MKISKKQQEEIDFFCKYASISFEPNQAEIEGYIRQTVYGENANGGRISESKRMFDIIIKMWREDLVRGLLFIDELYEDFGSHPFGKRLVDSVLKSLDFSKYKSGEGFVYISMMNLSQKAGLSTED